jgi:hypothetical protein
MINNEADYTSFKQKYGISNIATIDDNILKLWIIGNELIKFKGNTDAFVYHLLIANGAPGSADKYREIRMIKYDTSLSRVTDDNLFKVKNITLTENIDLFNVLFSNFSNN